MSGLRFSVLSLMALVALAAVAFVSLRTPSELWTGVVFTAAFALDAALVLAAAAARPGRRIVPGGAALFASLYLGLAFAPWASTEVRPYLLTTAALDRLFPVLHGRQPSFNERQAAVVRIDGGGTGSSLVRTNESFYAGFGSGGSLYFDYQRAGHSVAAMLWACLGAILGRFLGRRSDPAAVDSTAG